MTAGNFIVFIVDDDARMRESLSDLLESLGWRAVALGSAGEYISSPRPDLPACLILDVELPDGNGMEFCLQIQTVVDTQNTAIFAAIQQRKTFSTHLTRRKNAKTLHPA